MILNILNKEIKETKKRRKKLFVFLLLAP